jgi:hypothetical protein
MARRVPLETDLGDIRPHTKAVFEEFAARYEIYFAWGIGASGDHNVACQRDGTAVLPRAWDHLEV